MRTCKRTDVLVGGGGGRGSAAVVSGGYRGPPPLSHSPTAPGGHGRPPAPRGPRGTLARRTDGGSCPVTAPVPLPRPWARGRDRSAQRRAHTPRRSAADPPRPTAHKRRRVTSLTRNGRRWAGGGRHATGVRQEIGVSLGIGPVLCAPR